MRLTEIAARLLALLQRAEVVHVAVAAGVAENGALVVVLVVEVPERVVVVVVVAVALLLVLVADDLLHVAGQLAGGRVLGFAGRRLVLALVEPGVSVGLGRVVVLGEDLPGAALGALAAGRRAGRPERPLRVLVVFALLQSNALS